MATVTAPALSARAQECGPHPEHRRALRTRDLAPRRRRGLIYFPMLILGPVGERIVG
jgi:hypothetical protein